MQAIGERFGVVVANIRVVQVEELKVRVVVQRIAEPNRALVVEELHVQNGRAAGDVLRVDLLLAALAGGGGGEEEGGEEEAHGEVGARAWRHPS